MAQSDKQMAILKNKLQMPLIVRDMLKAEHTPSADENYALHEMLGNFSAEDALLCTAFTMKEISDYEDINSTNLTFLNMECERIIERYSARDDMASENPDLWSETQMNMLECLSEDLEELLELIELCHMSYEVTNPKITKFLDIMTAQLQSHIMIIDEAISMQQIPAHTNSIEKPAITGMEADNIIMFPS